MNHPNREQWISYLYHELPPDEHAALQAHANACAECRAQLDSWHGAKTKLDGWPLAALQRRPLILRNAVKWGIAAMLMIGFGFGLAKFTAPAFDSAHVEKILRGEFQQQLADARLADKGELAAVINQMKKQRTIDYAALREDLETVAVTAETSLQRTQRQIGQLSLIAQNRNDSSTETR